MAALFTCTQKFYCTAFHFRQSVHFPYLEQTTLWFQVWNSCNRAARNRLDKSPFCKKTHFGNDFPYIVRIRNNLSPGLVLIYGWQVCLVCIEVLVTKTKQTKNCTSWCSSFSLAYQFSQENYKSLLHVI